VVAKIRETYPAEDGVYTNFDGDDDAAEAISELVAAWEYLGSEN